MLNATTQITRSIVLSVRSPPSPLRAAVPLTLVLIAVIGKWVLRHRRENQAQHRLA